MTKVCIPQSVPVVPEGYRPCAGAVVFNRDGNVFMGCRSDLADDEPYRWQLPQGGIDNDENPEAAARRELAEETGIHSVELISAINSWLVYDFPTDVVGKRFKKYRGQAQLWYAYRFAGEDGEVNLGLSEPPEFQQWDWRSIKIIPELIVPFKRHVYEAIVQSFGSLGDDIRQGD